MIYFILFCIYIFFTCDSVHRILFGCGRKFKNDRKCKVWDCPNALECPFYGGGKS